jgi:hypothetical protein
MKCAIFGNVTPRTLLKVYRCFGDRIDSIWRLISEDIVVHVLVKSVTNFYCVMAFNATL